jgi:hypothetical protein
MEVRSCDILMITYSMEQSPSGEADQSSQLVKKFPAFYETRRFFTDILMIAGVMVCNGFSWLMEEGSGRQ